MKNILVYGDSNSWGAIPQAFRGAGGRYAPDIRWPGVLRTALGGEYRVVEEGLNGRTTCVDDPVEGDHKNGARHLIVALETHAPLDLVIIKLGTNDLKARLSMQAGDIADGAGRLAGIVQAYSGWPQHVAPKVLLVSPAPLAKLTWLGEMFAGGAEKSKRLASEYARVAKACGVAHFDAGSVVASSDIDGIHLDEAGHRALGEALAAPVRTLLGTPS